MYRLDVIDRHLILRLDGGCALIDTGSPLDIGRGRATTLLDEHWDPPSAQASVLDTVTAHLGVEVDWLIGHATLRRCRLVVDWTAGVADISAGPIDLPGSQRVPISLDLPVPIVDMIVDGAPETVRAVLDSGAALSYAPRTAVAGRAPIASQRDFHPAIGAFETDVWTLPAHVGGRDLVLEVGVLPEALERLFAGLSGWILGSDFFRDRAVVINYPDREVRDAPGGAFAPTAVARGTATPAG